MHAREDELKRQEDSGMHFFHSIPLPLFMAIGFYAAKNSAHSTHLSILINIYPFPKNK